MHTRIAIGAFALIQSTPRFYVWGFWSRCSDIGALTEPSVTDPAFPLVGRGGQVELDFPEISPVQRTE